MKWFEKFRTVTLGMMATLLGTGVLIVLVLSPFHPKRLAVVWAKAMENRGVIRRFFFTYRQIATESGGPLWLLILGMPLVAILVLLDDYA